MSISSYKPFGSTSFGRHITSVLQNALFLLAECEVEQSLKEIWWLSEHPVLSLKHYFFTTSGMVFCCPSHFCIVFSQALSYHGCIVPPWLPLRFLSVFWLSVYLIRLCFSQVLMSFSRARYHYFTTSRLQSVPVNACQLSHPKTQLNSHETSPSTEQRALGRGGSQGCVKETTKTFTSMTRNDNLSWASPALQSTAQLPETPQKLWIHLCELLPKDSPVLKSGTASSFTQDLFRKQNQEA